MASSGCSPRWMRWEQQKNGWCDYDSETTEWLEAVFCEGRPEVCLSDGHRVDLKEMSDTSTSENAVRWVRRLDYAPTSITWQWRAMTGWIPFTLDVGRHLEAARSKGYLETAFVLDGCGRYTVDFVDMRQRNTTSGFERDLRRIVPPTVAATPAAAVAEKIECTNACVAEKLVCSICLVGFGFPENLGYRLNKCRRGNSALTHAFHAKCIDKWFETGRGQCPVCKANIMVNTGTQPIDGTMSDHIEPWALPGFPSTSNTRVISYVFQDGVQGVEHPHPGQPYAGTWRTAYLPTPEADRHFRLLQIAFRRRLVFRVGRSLSTGRDNCVVWAGIHHKTNRHMGEFGYPDETYLSVLLDELRNNGVVDDDDDDDDGADRRLSRGEEVMMP